MVPATELREACSSRPERCVPWFLSMIDILLMLSYMSPVSSAQKKTSDDSAARGYQTFYRSCRSGDLTACNRSLLLHTQYYRPGWDQQELQFDDCVPG